MWCTPSNNVRVLRKWEKQSTNVAKERAVKVQEWQIPCNQLYSVCVQQFSVCLVCAEQVPGLLFALHTDCVCEEVSKKRCLLKRYQWRGTNEEASVSSLLWGGTYDEVTVKRYYEEVPLSGTYEEVTVRRYLWRGTYEEATVRRYLWRHFFEEVTYEEVPMKRYLCVGTYEVVTVRRYLWVGIHKKVTLIRFLRRRCLKSIFWRCNCEEEHTYIWGGTYEKVTVWRYLWKSTNKELTSEINRSCNWWEQRELNILILINIFIRLI